MSSIALVKTSAESLFPLNPANRYYEEDKKPISDKIHNAKYWIFGISYGLTVALVGAKLMSDYGVQFIPSDFFNTIYYPTLVTSVALMGATLAVTGIKLYSLDHCQPLDRSNSLGAREIEEYIKRIEAVQAVKGWSLIDKDSLNNLTNFLHRYRNIGIIDVFFDSHTKIQLTGLARIYLDPENRTKFKRLIAAFEKLEANVLSHAKSKGELADLLNVVKSSGKERNFALESRLEGKMDRVFADSYVAKVYLDDETKDLIVEFEDKLGKREEFAAPQVAAVNENANQNNNNNNN